MIRLAMRSFVVTAAVKERDANRIDFVTKASRHQCVPQLMNEDYAEIRSDRNCRMDRTLE